jgi:inosine-uridine nucleoside N-ribohydrolase
LGIIKTGVVKYLNKIEGVILQKTTAWYAADTITVAILLWPELMTASTEMQMSPVMCNNMKGSVIVDVNASQEKKNVQAVRSFNVEAYKDKLLKCLC